MFNFFLLCALSVFVFGVAHKGSFLTLTLAALLWRHHRHRAGIADLDIYEEPNRRYFRYRDYYADSGHPVLRDDRPGGISGGPGRWIGQIYPTSHFLTIARGTFSKALNISDLWVSFIPLLIAVPLVLGLSVLLLKKQEGDARITQYL